MNSFYSAIDREIEKNEMKIKENAEKELHQIILDMHMKKYLSGLKSKPTEEHYTRVMNEKDSNIFDTIQYYSDKLKDVDDKEYAKKLNTLTDGRETEMKLWQKIIGRKVRQQPPSNPTPKKKQLVTPKEKAFNKLLQMAVDSKMDNFLKNYLLEHKKKPSNTQYHNVRSQFMFQEGAKLNREKIQMLRQNERVYKELLQYTSKGDPELKKLWEVYVDRSQGAGLKETVKSAADYVKSYIPRWEDNPEPVMPGERHAPLILPGNRIGYGNYMGPGTNLTERIKKGVEPRTEADRISQAHDLRYGLARDQSDVVKADKKMINKLKQSKGKDHWFNIQLGMKPIQAKYYLEKLGLVKPGTFASFGDATPEEIKLYRKKLDELEAQGYGFNFTT